ncbi:MAG: sugar phosphate isomerase/epimerase [Glaciihabitans sp.]|jgi:sugar phosphate isomerase/epimerase|nr:sugar phosphate isomerase/epimerase [Glaciihabitans sp.]
MSLERFSLNQATVRYASLPEAVRVTVDAGIPSIGLWREPVAEFGLRASAKLVAASGLRVSTLCRGGFFTHQDGPARAAALDENRRAIEEAAALGAPALVLVVGGLPEGSRDLVGARARVVDALAVLAPDAAAAGVVLAIEALHPMYVSDRAVVSTLGQALDIAEQFAATEVGVVVDTFHVWWDPDLAAQVARAGRGGRIASYQVCDWVTPIATDPLLSRGYPGTGHIDFASFTRLVVEAGYLGAIEMEIFRQEVWDDEPAAVARHAAATFEQFVAPSLP